MIKSFEQLPLIRPLEHWSAPTTLPRLAGAKRIAIDTETCDPTLAELGPGVRRGGYVVGLSVAVEYGASSYLPVRHQGGGNLDETVVWRWARSELNAFDGEVVGANLVYDLDYFAENGVTFPKVKRFLDVQVAEPLLDEHRLSYSLDTLAEEYLGENKVEATLREAAIAYGFGTGSKDVKRNLWRLPAAYVGAYGEGDGDLPLRIMRLQEKKLEEQGLTELFDMESRLIPVLLAMRRRGVRVDIGRAEEVRSRLVKERDELLRTVRRLAGPKAELMAPESFSKALTERGLQFPLTMKTGKPSIKKEWLVANAHDPLVSAILKGRRVATIISTFIDGHVFTHAVKGRIHCVFNQLKGDDSGTIARFSSDSPNLQNLPARDAELGPQVRGLFIPEETERWSCIDFSQIEYRFLTHFAVGPGADEARHAYHSDPKTDFHTLCAQMLNFDPKNKGERTKIKNTNFCCVYGGGVTKLAQTFGCSVEEAEVFYKLYNDRLPFVKKTAELASKAAHKRGFVRTVMNRRQRFPMWESMEWGAGQALPYEQAKEKYGDRIRRSHTHAALNRVLQGSAADQMKKAIVDVWESGVCGVLGAPLITVHDELDISRPDTTEGKEAITEVKAIMERAIKLRVPVIAEMKEGADWGACA
jgi:DNA polymerase I-like protein with 3'-5' exonuclease and polymerase domains